MKTKNLFLSATIAFTVLFTSCFTEEPPFLRVVSETSISAPPEASQQFIRMDVGNTSWSASVDASWCTLSESEGGSNNSTHIGLHLFLNVQANPTLEERTAIITIRAGSQSQQVTLTQAAGAPALSTYPSFIHAEGVRTEYTINVTSNLQWTAELVDAELREWISINPTSGIGNGSITVSLETNRSFARRHAFISFSADGIQRTTTVLQKGAHRLEPDQFTAVTINGITWATRNVNEFGSFVHFSEPHNPGKYFQFNRPTAYNFIDGRIEPPLKYDEINEDSNWTLWNDPCPCGWRLPTMTEMENLRNSGFSWVDEFAGAWFGTDAETATFEAPGNAIFLPVGGQLRGDEIIWQSIIGEYWTANQANWSFGRTLSFQKVGYIMFSCPKRYALSVRCVTE